MERSRPPGSGQTQHQPSSFANRMERHVLQVLVKVSTKRQVQTGWKGHALQVLVEGSTKRQALQTGWKGHVLQVLVKGSTKRQANRMELSRPAGSG